MHVVIGQDFTGLVTWWVSRVNAVGAPPSLPLLLSQLHTENQALSIREVCFWFLLFGVLFCFVFRSLDHRCFHWLCWGVGWPPWGQHFSSGWREQREDGPDNSAGVGGWKSCCGFPTLCLFCWVWWGEGREFHCWWATRETFLSRNPADARLLIEFWLLREGWVAMGMQRWEGGRHWLIKQDSENRLSWGLAQGMGLGSVGLLYSATKQLCDPLGISPWPHLPRGCSQKNEKHRAASSTVPLRYDMHPQI